MEEASPGSSSPMHLLSGPWGLLLPQNCGRGSGWVSKAAQLLLVTCHSLLLPCTGLSPAWQGFSLAR